MVHSAAPDVPSQTGGELAEKLTIACGEGGIVCGAKVTGGSEEEVLAKAVEHAREKHGVDPSQSRTLTRYLRSLIRPA